MCQAIFPEEDSMNCLSAFLFVLIDLKTNNDFIFWMFENNAQTEEEMASIIIELGLGEDEYFICSLFSLPINYPKISPYFGYV
jgi:hypothetical protein